MDLAEAIREKRKERELTQAGLSAKAGITQGHLSQIEKGSRRPTLPTLLKLRDALELTPEEFSEWVEGAAA